MNLEIAVPRELWKRGILALKGELATRLPVGTPFLARYQVSHRIAIVTESYSCLLKRVIDPDLAQFGCANSNELEILVDTGQETMVTVIKWREA